jgi:uncharacterized protein (DUF305 family)
MKRLFVLFTFPLLLLASCGRRPVQKDLPVENTMQRSDHKELESSPGAADAPFELQIIDTLIAHDLDTIDAAQLVATRAGHPELKQLARSMISDRQQRISQLREWRTRWYGDWSPAINLDLPGAREGVQIDFEKLDPLKENAFDQEFLREMIPHEHGAVLLAQDVLGRETNAELKTLSENLIKTQEAEAAQMQAWQDKWSAGGGR